MFRLGYVFFGGSKNHTFSLSVFGCLGYDTDPNNAPIAHGTQTHHTGSSHGLWMSRVLLMEDILHPPRCIKPCTEWDFYHINWLAGFFPPTVSSIQSVEFPFEITFFHVFFLPEPPGASLGLKLILPLSNERSRLNKGITGGKIHICCSWPWQLCIFIVHTSTLLR